MHRIHLGKMNLKLTLDFRNFTPQIVIGKPAGQQ